MWFYYCSLHLFYILAVHFTTGAFFWTHQWVVVLPGWCRFVVSIRLLWETVEYYHICVLLSAVASSIKWNTDTLFLCKSFCRSMTKSFQGQEGSQCDTFLLWFCTMMPLQEWIIFSFRMNGFCLSCIVLTNVSWCLRYQDWRCHSERTCFVWLHIEICFPCNVKYL